MTAVVGWTQSSRNSRVWRMIDKMRPKTKTAIRKAWFSVGRDLKIVATAEVLRAPKGGRVYIIRSKGGRTRRHTASAPGETHANRSGELRKSISWRVYGYARMDFGYGFTGDAVDYDSFVEDGTSKMDPRPTIANAVKTVQKSVRQHVERHIMNEFKRL